jgi:hypothetical protein
MNPFDEQKEIHISFVIRELRAKLAPVAYGPQHTVKPAFVIMVVVRLVEYKS